MAGGCPQVTCDSLLFSALVADNWTPNYKDGIYHGIFKKTMTPNVYEQIGNSNSQNAANGGTYYLF